MQPGQRSLLPGDQAADGRLVAGAVSVLLPGLLNIGIILDEMVSAEKDQIPALQNVVDALGQRRVGGSLSGLPCFKKVPDCCGSFAGNLPQQLQMQRLGRRKALSCAFRLAFGVDAQEIRAVVTQKIGGHPAGAFDGFGNGKHLRNQHGFLAPGLFILQR